MHTVHSLITPADLNSPNATILSNFLSSDLSTADHGSSSPPSQESAAKLGWILIQKRWISATQLQTVLLHQSH